MSCHASSKQPPPPCPLHCFSPTPPQVEPVARQTIFEGNASPDHVESNSHGEGKPTGSRPLTTLSRISNKNSDVPVGGVTDDKQWRPQQQYQQQEQQEHNLPPSMGGNNQQQYASSVGSLPAPAGGNVRSVGVGVGSGVGVGVGDGGKNEAKVSSGGATIAEVQGGEGGGTAESRQGEGDGSAVWNAYQRGKWIKGQWIPKVYDSFSFWGCRRIFALFSSCGISAVCVFVCARELLQVLRCAASWSFTLTVPKAISLLLWPANDSPFRWLHFWKHDDSRFRTVGFCLQNRSCLYDDRPTACRAYAQLWLASRRRGRVLLHSCLPRYEVRASCTSFLCLPLRVTVSQIRCY